MAVRCLALCRTVSIVSMYRSASEANQSPPAWAQCLEKRSEVVASSEATNALISELEASESSDKAFNDFWKLVPQSGRVYKHWEGPESVLLVHSPA